MGTVASVDQLDTMSASAMRRTAGHPISQFDCQIAAMTRARGASLATHNTKDFESCGIDIVDPWSSG